MAAGRQRITFYWLRPASPVSWYTWGTVGREPGQVGQLVCCVGDMTAFGLQGGSCVPLRQAAAWRAGTFPRNPSRHQVCILCPDRQTAPPYRTTGQHLQAAAALTREK
jgi:hypothetical protein